MKTRKLITLSVCLVLYGYAFGQTDINWTNLNGVQLTGGTPYYTKTAANGNTTGIGSASQVLKSDCDWTYELGVGSQTTISAGISQSFSSTWQDMDYAILVDVSWASVYEQGNIVSGYVNTGTRSSSDYLSIQKVGNDISFTVFTSQQPSGVLIHTINIPAMPDFHPEFHIFYKHNRIQNGTIKHSTDQDNDWYVAGTNDDVACSIDDDIYTMGLVAIGDNTPTATLDVAGNLRLRNLTPNPSATSVLTVDVDGFVFSNPAPLQDIDWLTSNGNTPGSISDIIYTEGKVGINEENPNGLLGIKMTCTDSPGLNIRTNGTCANNTFGNPIEVEQFDVMSGAYETDFVITQNARVGVSTSEPLADLDVAGQGIMLLEAFEKTICAAQNAGLYFRRDFSPYGWANSPSQLKNMSIKPRGVCSPSTPDGLEINGADGLVFTTSATDRMYITSSGSVRIGYTAPECDEPTPPEGFGGCWNGFTLDVNGSIGNNGQFVTSDKRYKTNISTLTDPMATINRLRGVSYVFRHEEFPEMKFREGNNIGFIAQELQEVLPELVSENQKGYLAVNYQAIVPILTEALKRQDEELQDQTEEIENLKNELSALRMEIDQIKHDITAICNSDCQAVQSGTLQEEEKMQGDSGSHYNVYPNPTSETFRIQPSDSEMTTFDQVVIISNTGAVLYKESNIPVSKEFSIKSLAAGNYIIQVHSNKEVEELKLQVL